jgi:Reverse transcriptase (RNA-dependent DNA polymerase)
MKRQISEWSNQVETPHKEDLRLQKRIQDFQLQHPLLQNEAKERTLLQEYDKAEQRLEEFWRQRSRLQWAELGDCNTKFFHAMATYRKRQNIIVSVETTSGRRVEADNEVNWVFIEYFKELYTSSIGTGEGDERIMDFMAQIQVLDHQKIPQRLATIREQVPDQAEIRETIFQLHPEKAPGPDGLTARFVQRNWETLTPDICRIMQKAFATSTAPEEWAGCHIMLIPKIAQPNAPKDYKPISIGNILYWLLAKIITNRLQPLMQTVISKAQTAFIRGRSIRDSTILMQEVLHSFGSRAYKEKAFVLKADITKAFNTLEWSFIKHALAEINIPQKLSRLIMSCLSFSKITILINGKGGGFFKPTRGLRQGCPLSPYLFIISMEFLSKWIDRTLLEGKIKGIRVTPQAPTLTHSIYADDLIVFAQATVQEVAYLQDVLHSFGECSGLRINPSKSIIWFSKMCTARCKQQVLNQLQAQIAKDKEMYLGIIMQQNSRAGDQNRALLEEKFIESFAGWKMNTLSPAGRLALIKSVLISKPIYYMSNALLPVNSINHLTGLMRRFFWGKLDKTRYMALIGWDKICMPFEQGGLNVRDLKIMNEALVLKLVWQFAAGQDKQWVQIMQAKYCVKHVL